LQTDKKAGGKSGWTFIHKEITNPATQAAIADTGVGFFRAGKENVDEHSRYQKLKKTPNGRVVSMAIRQHRDNGILKNLKIESIRTFYDEDNPNPHNYEPPIGPVLRKLLRSAN
jgi:hypothetical protein